MDGMDAVNSLINSGGVPELADIVAQVDFSKRQRMEHKIHLIFDEPMDMEMPKQERDHRNHGPWNNQPPNGPWNHRGPPPPHGGNNSNSGGGGRRQGNHNNNDRNNRGGGGGGRHRR